MTIRCTAKLLKEMGISKTSLADIQDAGFDEWYAHLFFLQRRKCVIFCHVATLYAVVAYDVKREQIKRLDALFSNNLGRRLYEDGFSADTIKGFLEKAGNVVCARTIDKKTLGSINQMIFEFSNNMNVGGYGAEENFKDSEKRLTNGLYQKNGRYIKPAEELTLELRGNISLRAV
jgi:hypothetical protein